MMLVKIKPAEDGAKVALPGTEGYLRADGQSVPLNSYWRRRLRDGSVVKADTETKPAKTTAKKKD